MHLHPRYLSLLIYAATLSAGWSMTACTGRKPPEAGPSAAEPAIPKPDRVQHNRLRDSCVQLLRTGDLALRTGNDITSRMFCEFNRIDKTYSHCGMVVVEHGYPFVYHSIGGEDNPDQRLRRDSAHFFFSPENNLGLGIARYRLADSVLGRLQQTVWHWYRRQPRFDMNFDLETDDRLYCSEFIYKALSAATGDPDFVPSTYVYGRRFIGIDNLFINPHTDLVCELKYK